MRLKIKITFKLLHNSRETDLHPPVELGTMRAYVGLAKEGSPIRLSHPDFDLDAYNRAGMNDAQIGALQGILRNRVKSFMADSRYPIVWSEDNCIETYITEI